VGIALMRGVVHLVTGRAAALIGSVL